MKYIGFDTETHRIGPGKIAPPMVCLSLAEFKEECDADPNNPDDVISSMLFASCDPDLPGMIEQLLLDKEVTLIAHGAAYDMGVIAAKFPQLIPLIFAKYNDGLIHCTIVREKLIHLSTFGTLGFYWLPDGGKGMLFYDLASALLRYSNIDISEDKTAEDSWRLNYEMLDGKPVSEYPEEAKRYAEKDAVYVLWVYTGQNEAVQNAGASVATHEFNSAVDFSLFLATCVGMETDEVKRAEIAAMLEKELAPEKTALLVEAGILDPGEPPRPHKKNPNKFTAGKDPSIKKAPLQELVKQICEQHGIDLKMTPGREDKTTGERVPGISTDAEVMDKIAHLDPVLEQYEHRQALSKLVTTELPRMQAPVVYFPFDVLKKTGRTSSSASDLYPSACVQNIDPRARPAYKARDGWLIFSGDYASLELVTYAQKQLELFGHSTLADIINAGGDPHAHLGAQMGYAFDSAFRESCDKAGCVSRDDLYNLFLAMKKDDNEQVKAFFKHYRTFAKPTGLGYPGGLGAETFVSYAKKNFGVVVTIEQAERFRDIWKDSIPEAQMSFDWVKRSCKDPNDPEHYAYTTPLGMVRARCEYTEVANGAFLQSPAAEGMKLAFYTFVEACYDFSKPNPLLGCHPLATIHDEILAEIPDDEFSHERAMEICRIMVECMRQITPDVAVRVEPKLMRRWHKEAESVYYNDRLIPWEPTGNPF